MEIRLSEQTKQLVRFGAAVWKKSEPELVELAVQEFMVNHKQEVDDRVREAKESFGADELSRFLREEGDGPEF